MESSLTNTPKHSILDRHEMKIKLLTLSFREDSDVREKDFLADYFLKYVNQVRISLCLAILFYALFGILDVQLMPEMKDQLWLIRYAVFCPVTAFVIILTYLPSYEKYMQLSLAFVVLLAGLGIITMIIIAPPPINYSYYAGLMLIFIFGYTFIRARFIWATITGWLLVLCYEIMATVIIDTPLPILMSNNFFFISANTIGMFSCYSIEYAARRDFYLAQLLHKEQQKTQETNLLLEDRVKDRTEMLAHANEDLKLEIVERKRVEQELRKIHNELETRVQTRTRDLEKLNIEFKKAKEIADESAKTKSRFLANMSHEIRTPLNAIIGMSELAKNPDLKPPQRLEYVSIINSSANALLGIINDVLDFSKIEAGKLEVEKTPFQIREIIYNTADLFMDDLRKKKLELVIDIASDVPYEIMGDPLRLQQVIVNLTSNALKFTESGDIYIYVQKVAEDSEQVRLKFGVRDSGIGISPKLQATLFDAFAQADSSTTRKFGGTGLGLAICQKIISMLNGNITVESTPGKGSLFEFTLEFKKGALSPDRKFEFPSNLQDKQVLVAEGNSSTRQVLKQMLESFGIQPHLVKTGQEALSLSADFAGTNPYDLLIADHNLPDMPGESLAKQIKAQTPDKGLPVILIGACNAIETKSLLSSENVESLLLKPVKPSHLFDAIMESFGHQAVYSSQNNLHELNNFSASAKILLVEDNPINQMVAIEILKIAGMTVHTAVNGLEALDKIKNETYDVVLMDVQMPEMDGLQATARIRADLGLKNLPIIAMTAHAIHGDREKCLAAGMNDYISKPIDRLKLFQVLNNYISGDGSVAAQEDSPVSRDEETTSNAIEIQGLDVEVAMERMGCDFERYLEIVVDSWKDLESMPPKLRELISHDDLDGARDLNHSLKGSAGNLAAQDLYAAAVSLEEAIDAEDRAGINTLLSQIEDRFAQLADSLKKYVG